MEWISIHAFSRMRSATDAPAVDVAGSMRTINKFWEKSWWSKKEKVVHIDLIKDLTLPHWKFEKE